MSRSLERWAREMPTALARMPDIALDEMRDTATTARDDARATVPVRTGALQRSILDRDTSDGAVVYSEDPAAEALRVRGRDYIGDAVSRAARDLPERLTRRWTEELTDG